MYDEVKLQTRDEIRAISAEITDLRHQMHERENQRREREQANARFVCGMLYAFVCGLIIGKAHRKERDSESEG